MKKGDKLLVEFPTSKEKFKEAVFKDYHYPYKSPPSIQYYWVIIDGEEWLIACNRIFVRIDQVL